jgi:hypothetical protein
MRGNDLNRTHANTFESILTPAKVNPQTFGKLYCKPVDGEIYAQILYLPQFDFGPKGKKNAIVIATMRNQVSVLDADDQNAAPIWQKSYGMPTGPARALSPTTCSEYKDISQWVGILSTPAVDMATGTLYFVARTGQAAGQHQQRLFAVSLVDGSDRTGSPVTITASANGANFNSNIQNQRAALTLHSGTVYIAWSSFCDFGNYKGWLLGYDAKTLQRTVTFNTAPTGEKAGIWMSGSGPAIDTDGTFYLVTGNGTADLAGGPNRGESFLKLRRQGATFQLVDYFTPKNYCFLENTDRDLGSAGVLLVPGSNLVLGGGKDGKVYVVDKTNLGQYSGPAACAPGAPSNPPGTDKVVQTLNVATSSNPPLAHNHSTPVYWKSQAGEFIYTWAEEDYLIQWKLENGRLSLFKMSTFKAADDPSTNAMGGSAAYVMPGGTMSLSANGDKTDSAILWATMPVSKSANNEVVPGVMRAFDASDVSKPELWNSLRNRPRDDTDKYAKFNPVTVYNGRVYAPTFKNPEATNQYCVYGLLGQ